MLKLDPFFIPKILMKLLFLWVKKHIHVQEFKAISVLFRNLKENRQYWRLRQQFLTFQWNKRMKFIFKNCFALSCHDESLQLLAGFDQRQRWNPKLRNYWCAGFLKKIVTHKFIVGKKEKWEKKIITVKVSTKHEMGNLGLAVHCISKTYSTYCIPFCKQRSPISLRKKT